MKRKMGGHIERNEGESYGIQEYTRKSVVNEEGVTTFISPYVVSDWLMKV